MLCEEAKEMYLHFTFISYDYGFIDRFEFSSRLKYLSSITNDQELIHWLKQYIETEDDREKDYDETESLDDSGGNENDFLIEKSNSSNKSSPMLALITAQNGVLGAKWEFHQYDPDYFPSIPHGHLLSNKKIKLDSYRGFTYDTRNHNKPMTREKRKFIINLWNNNKFRIFALTHINFYIVNFPKHSWKVNPRSPIPRKRP